MDRRIDKGGFDGEDSMNNDHVEQELAQFFIEREGEGIMASIREMDLIEAGILDSLDLVSLAAFIEERFDRKLAVDDPKTFAAMRNYDTLVHLSKTGEARPADD